jgi:hypothetical protein
MIGVAEPAGDHPSDMVAGLEEGDAGSVACRRHRRDDAGRRSSVHDDVIGTRLRGLRRDDAGN